MGRGSAVVVLNLFNSVSQFLINCWWNRLRALNLFKIQGCEEPEIWAYTAIARVLELQSLQLL